MSDTTARYWLVWMTAIIGLFIFGKFTARSAAGDRRQRAPATT